MDVESTPEPATMKERAFVWVMNRVIGLVNRKIDVAELQQEHNAFKERVGEIRITDLNKSWYFLVKGGEVRMLVKPPKVHGGFRTTSDVMLSLAMGKRRVMNPATGSLFDTEYTPVHALTQGDLQLWGDAVTNDALLFARLVYREVFPTLKEDLAELANA